MVRPIMNSINEQIYWLIEVLVIVEMHTLVFPGE
jgi:hypothetical protein